MVLTALVLVCCAPLYGDVPSNSSALSPADTKAVVTSAPPPEVSPVKPDSPLPKATFTAASKSDLDFTSTGDPGAPSLQPALSSPVKPATAESYETPRQRKFWYGLMVASHSAAAFDAWTTRRAVSGGYGVESDPLQRPFAHSGAIYATTQITPLIMDYLGHRMMRSSHPWIRNAWWVPQSASASVSLAAGLHNYSVVP